MVNYKRIYELDAHSSIVSTDVIPISATWSWNAEKQTISGLTSYISSNITAIPATSIGAWNVDNIEFSYLNWVTSAIQTQLNDKFSKSIDDTDDITEWATNKFATTAEKAKLGYISITQSVDLDTLESDTATNNAKVTNATHTGEMTGDTALTADPTLVSNKTLKSTLAWTEEVLINDAWTLKKTTTQDIADLWGGWWSSTWWSITGTLSSQTDLQTALDSKVDENVAITWGTKTKITYDAKWLVTAWDDATTADIADSLDKRYVTDAQQTVIGNTSWTNTGDNAVNSNYSWLVSNATHTGEMAWDTVLTADPTLISNKTLKSTLSWAEEVLINDAWTLKKTTAQDIADLGGWGGGWSQPYTALSTDTTITQGNVYWVTASAVDITLTLTDGTTAGQTLTVKKLDSTDYTVTIANASIDWETSIELTIEDESVDLYRTGTAFIIK